MREGFKFHGYGNSFIILAARPGEEERESALCSLLCDVRFGVGADGCVFTDRPSGNRVSVRIYNRDGSGAGMSGNGVRCACAYLHHLEKVADRVIHVDTASGPKRFELLECAEGVWRYRSWMGRPRFSPAEIPMIAPGGPEKAVDFSLRLDEETVRITALWVGNPQCVVFVDRLPEEEEFRRLGAGLEAHPAFPEKTNVSFVAVEHRRRLRIRIWERGVGPTSSSGTGCCGAAVAALESGRVESPVEVDTGAGSQEVSWSPGEEIRLIGESRLVGRIELFEPKGGGIR